MKTLLLPIAIISSLMLAACSHAPRKEIVTQITLDASPQDVWAVLSDGKRYGEWNPFIIDMQGPIEKGAKIRNTMQPTAKRQMVFKPKILVAKPNQELRWLGRTFLPGIFDGEHYFLLRGAGEQTVLTHGEKFSGIGLWFLDVEQFQRNFEEMNGALKQRLADLEKPPSNE